MFLCRVFLQTPHIPSINHILWVYYTTIQTLICTHKRANTHTQTKFAMGIPVEGLDGADRQRAFLPSPSLPHPFLSPQPENFHLALPTSKTWLTVHRVDTHTLSLSLSHKYTHTHTERDRTTHTHTHSRIHMHVPSIPYYVHTQSLSTAHTECVSHIVLRWDFRSPVP